MDENVQTLHKKSFELKDCIQIHGVQQAGACQTLAIVEYGSKKLKEKKNRFKKPLAQLALEISKLCATVTPKAYLTTLRFVVSTQTLC